MLKLEVDGPVQSPNAQIPLTVGVIWRTEVAHRLLNNDKNMFKPPDQKRCDNTDVHVGDIFDGFVKVAGEVLIGSMTESHNQKYLR